MVSTCRFLFVVVVSMVGSARVGLGQGYQGTPLIPAGGVSGDRFGSAVALSGNRALVGAMWDDDKGFNSGSAQILERNVVGSWVPVAKLVASDGAMHDEFGYSVSLSGDRALVGAHFHAAKAGAAYVFERNPFGVWEQTAKLVDPDGQTSEEFGFSVSIAGDRAVVGAIFDRKLVDNTYKFVGAVHVFERQPGGSWVHVQKLEPDTTNVPYFGYSVSQSGDRIAVGRHAEASVYVFDKGGGGIWFESAHIVGPNPVLFGGSVSIFGERLLVGVFSDNDGDAYVYEHQGGGSWVLTATLPAGIGAPWYGSTAVSLSGERALVGWYGTDSAAQEAGLAKLFQRTPSGAWHEVATLAPASPAAFDNFGYAVALSGDRALVGAWLDDAPGIDSGSATLFEPACTNYVSVPIETLVVPPGGGTPLLATIGRIEAGALAGSRISALFQLEPAYAYLDTCYDFRWINVLETKVQDGVPQIADVLGPGGSGTFLGLLPAIDPTPALGPEPFYYTAAEWAAGEVGAMVIRREGLSSLFVDAPISATDLVFRTYLVAHDVAAGNLGAQLVAVLGGFTWRYDGQSIGVADSLVCGPASDGLEWVSAALAAGTTGCPGHPGCPGFPGWHAVSAALGPCRILSGQTGSVSLSAGGAETLSIDASSLQGGRAYLLLGSASGTQPGLTSGPFTVPVVAFDWYWNLIFMGPGFPFNEGILGVLDLGGQGARQFVVPPASPPGLAGLTLHHAVIGLELTPKLAIAFASDAVSLQLVP